MEPQLFAGSGVTIDWNRNILCFFGGFPPKEGSGKTSMRTVMASPHCALAGAVLGSAALLCSSSLLCTPALQAQEVAPSVRIANRIDERNLVALKGNIHPAAKARMMAGG